MVSPLSIFLKNLTEKFLLLQIVPIFGVLKLFKNDCLKRKIFTQEVILLSSEQFLSTSLWESDRFVKLNSSLRHNDSTIFY